MICCFLATAAHAAVPVVWTNTPAATQPYPIKPVPHGSTVDLAVTLKGYTTPPIADGADVRLWFQTNGMGSAWWSAPATLDGDTITATFGAEQDTGADRVALFFGAPSNVFASAILRLTHSPGFTPNVRPPPVARLDFSALEVLNAPYYTQAETDARIVELSPAAQPPGNYLAVSNAAMHAVTFDEYGEVTVDRLLVHDLAVNGSPGWPTYRILFGPNELDGTYLYWDADSGRFATWRTADGGDYLATALDVANSAVAATNYTDLATNALAMSTASALGSYLPRSGGILTGDLSLSGSASIQYTGVWYVRLYANVGEAGNRIYTNDGDTWQSERGLAWFDETTNHVHAAAVAATNYTNASISPTNPAFAAAVRDVPITGADSSDLVEIAEYGSYGSVGAAILALIAGLAALKRGKVTGALGSGGWVVSNGQRDYVFASDTMADDESTIARIGDLRYAKHTLTTPAGAATLLDRAVNKYTGDSTFTSCTFTLPPAFDGQVRDFLLDVDNSANGSDVAAEFYGLGTDYALAVNADDVSSSKTAGQVLAEMTVVEAGTRARFYFTEANQTQVATVGNESVDLPILTVQRMTIAPTTIQGGA